MLSLTVNHKSGQPLVDQIVAGVKRQIDDRQLRPGTKLPSIRTFADTHSVSRFTVVEAYDRLVAMGYLQSRRGAGFYTAAAPARPEGPQRAASDAHKRNEELVWLIRRLLGADENTLLAGGPWLPNSWLDEAGIRQSLNVLARKNGAYLLEYGHPFGYLPLREHLALMLAGLGVTAHPGQILLTQGTSQALELVIPLFAQARRRRAGGRSRLLQHVRQFAPAGRRGAPLRAAPRHPKHYGIVITTMANHTTEMANSQSSRRTDIRWHTRVRVDCPKVNTARRKRNARRGHVAGIDGQGQSRDELVPTHAAQRRSV